MTHLERGTIFMSYCYSGRIIYDDACHLKKFCVNPVRKEVTALSKRLGKMDMVVEKLRTFKELLFARFTLWRTELLFKCLPNLYASAALVL